MALDITPNGWTQGDVDRFNELLAACEAYMIFDYARKQVAGTNQFLSARQADLGALITNNLGPTFINGWNT